MEQKDPEAGHLRRLSWFRIVFDQAVLTPEIIDHPYPGSGTPDDPYLVGWLENDPRDPMQFPVWIKWSLTQVLAFPILAVSFVSSAYSGGISEVVKSLGGSQEANVLGVSIFVLGFASGPFLWGPLSELYGRQYFFFITYMVHTAFNAGGAGAKNLQTLLVLRFFSGDFGASPLTNAGGAIADMFAASEGGLAMTLFALAPFLGPVIGPVVGGFVGEKVGWRWLMGVMTIFTGIVWIIGALILPETTRQSSVEERENCLNKRQSLHFQFGRRARQSQAICLVQKRIGTTLRTYADPKAYRPIALLSTIGKTLEAVIATCISYMVEAYSLLPQTHVGGRRGRSCEHAIHLLLE